MCTFMCTIGNSLLPGVNPYHLSLRSHPLHQTEDDLELVTFLTDLLLNGFHDEQKGAEHSHG